MKKISIAFLSTLIFTPAEYKNLYQQCQEQKSIFTERHAEELLSCSEDIPVIKPEIDYKESADYKLRLQHCDEEQKALKNYLDRCYPKNT